MKDIIPGRIHWLQSYYLVATGLKGRIPFGSVFFKNRFACSRIDLIDQPVRTTIFPDDLEIADQIPCKCITHPHKSISIGIFRPAETHRELSILWL